MSYSSARSTSVDDRETMRRGVAPAAAVVLLTTAVCTSLGAHDLREILVVMAIVVAAVVGVYGFLLPRALRRESAGGTALALSLVAAALTLPAFWSGLPLVLGVAGTMLGYSGRTAASGSGKSIAAVALGSLASLMYVSIYVMETFAL